MMESPIIEPLYLFSGAAPIEELRRKFTLAAPCRVDHVVEPGPLTIGPFDLEVVALPGHALNQVGVAVDSDAERPVLFCADAVFPRETLRKHKVLFCVDLDETLATLEQLPEQPYAHFAPGHGPVYAAGDEIASICAANRERLEAVRGRVYAALEEPQETSAIVRQVAGHFGLEMTTPTAYSLTRAPVLAALSSLERAREVEPVMKENRLLWQRKGAG